MAMRKKTWATPQCADEMGARGGLDEAIERHAKKGVHKQMMLVEQIIHDPRNSGQQNQGSRSTTGNIPASQPTGQGSDVPLTRGAGSLNPAWCAQLMGFPAYWLAAFAAGACASWETRGFRRFRTKFSDGLERSLIDAGVLEEKK